VRDAPKDYDEVSPRNYDDLVTYDKIGGTQSITGFVKQDHRAIEEYYSRIINSSDSDEQTRFQNQFVWALARHSIGEELVLYPAIEEYVEGGKAIADKDREQHQTVSL
jgi:hemerythrin superfamily protein